MGLKNFLDAAAEKRRAAARVLLCQEILFKAEMDYKRIAAAIFEILVKNANVLNVAPPVDIADIVTLGESSPSTYVYKYLPLDTFDGARTLEVRMITFLSMWLGITKSDFVKKVKISVIGDRIILIIK